MHRYFSNDEGVAQMGDDSLNPIDDDRAAEWLELEAANQGGVRRAGLSADVILLSADTLDDRVDSLTGHLSALSDDRSRLVTLAGHWWDVAEKLDEHSRPLADQARRLSETLAQLDEALIKMSEPIGVFVGVAGRTADAMRDLANS